jgi:Tetratricopeptide repeat
LLLLLAAFASAQEQPNVALDTSATLFTVLSTINLCGYDQELGFSDPLRSHIRGEVAQAVQQSEEAKQIAGTMCEFYQQHRRADASKNLAQYISLSLFLNPPPALTPKLKESELPPDVTPLLGLLPFIQSFDTKAGLQGIWEKNHPAYSALTIRYHEPLSKMLFDTEVYLKVPSAGYLGRQFTVYVDPMGAPSQANARNYGSDYYVVISPGIGASLKMEQIRHAYLHYLLDPLALKYPSAMKRLEPLLNAVKAAPMDQSFKSDVSLLVTECLIRAIEARTTVSNKVTEAQREQLVQASLQQGFTLTRYFYEALLRFEKDPAGLRDSYLNLISNIDLRKELRHASEVKFASTADPELLHLAPAGEGKLLIEAEQRLSRGDAESARQLAREALEQKREDPGRALFILAQVATMTRDMQGAQNYFQRALEVAGDPKVVAWSHIYLGRIFDLQEQHEAARDQYRAALNASATLPEAKAAAQRGLEKPYQPSNRPEQDDKDDN